MGKLSTQKKPMSSMARLTVLFPDPESPVTITMRKFFNSCASMVGDIRKAWLPG
jgi:hypothetical protein